MNSETDSHASSDTKQKISRFEFTGTGKEYFGIWIVNILLTIVTLGIYSAWAKVRNKQYFYGNTYLEGSSFEYTALPTQILKGRIIAVVFFVLYNIAASFQPTIGIILGLLLFVLAPWIIMKSLAFNARYSQYRNIRFGFHQSLKESATVFILVPLLALSPIIILFAVLGPILIDSAQSGDQSALAGWPIGVLLIGLPLWMYAAYPYVIYRTKRYVADNHRYGNADFNLRLSGPKPFYKLYLKAFLIFSAAALCIGAVVFSLGLATGKSNFAKQNPEITSPLVEYSNIAGEDLNNPDLENPDLENLDLENLDLQSLGLEQSDLEALSAQDLENLDLEDLDLENLDLENLDLEELGLENLDLENFDLQNIDLEDLETESQPSPVPAELAVVLFIGQLLSLFLYLFIFAYIAAHTYNIIYQNTLVGNHLLRAKMKPMELAMIYFTNTLGIILTLGLFIPWAMVRTARYRVANTALQINGDLDNFVATQDEHQNVFGEEFGEVFDLDVGI